MPGRERLIKTDVLHPAASYLVAVAATATGERDVTWIQSHGKTVAALIPAASYHPPGECCCKHCPWRGDHPKPDTPEGATPQ